LRRSTLTVLAAAAALLDAAGVETLLIGDSLGNVLQGHETTLPVTLRDICYHTACVARAQPSALKRFYSDWYRPDLMAVVAVGDFDVANVEALIRKHFGGLTMPRNPRPRGAPAWTCPAKSGGRAHDNVPDSAGRRRRHGRAYGKPYAFA